MSSNFSSSSTPFDVRIGGGHTALDWWRCFAQERLSREGLLRAVDILDTRIRGRFFDMAAWLDEPIRSGRRTNRLTPNGSRPAWFPGFTILAIECLLVETLQTFIGGLRDTNNVSEDVFCTFFVSASERPVKNPKKLCTLSPYFGVYFDRAFNRLAEANSDTHQKFGTREVSVLYRHFRCGIFHQGEIVPPSTIRDSPRLPLWEWQKVVLDGEDREGMRLNRRIFHALLERAYLCYLDDLKRFRDPVLWRNFARKVGYICGIAAAEIGSTELHVERLVERLRPDPAIT